MLQRSQVSVALPHGCVETRLHAQAPAAGGGASRRFVDGAGARVPAAISRADAPSRMGITGHAVAFSPPIWANRRWLLPGLSIYLIQRTETRGPSRGEV